MRFKPDGTKMFAIDSWFSIIQWDLSTPWDVTTAVDSGGFVLIRDNENNDFDFTEDGKKLFVLGSGASLDGADDRIYELDLIDAFDITTASYVTRPNPSRHITENEPEGFSMRPDGTRMWVLGTVSRKGIYQYNLSPPFDIFSGGNPFESFSTALIESNTDAPQAPWSLRFSGNPKGSKAYFTSGWYPFGGSPNSLYELSMPFSQTTRTKPFGSVGALLKAIGGDTPNFDPAVAFMGAKLVQKQTKTTDPDQFKIGATFGFTTAVPAFPSVRLKGTSGVSGGILPVEPKISAFLQRTVGIGGIGNEPEINALLSTTGATVTKFTCVNAHRKRLGINGTEGAGLKSSGINALLASGTAIKETFVGAKLKFPIIEQFFTSARLVGEDNKIKTFGIGAIIISDFNTNGGNGITKPVLFGAILSKPFKQFSIDSNISIPAGTTPFTNFKIDAVINGLTVEFDIDVVIEDPFQVLESESVL